MQVLVVVETKKAGLVQELANYSPPPFSVRLFLVNSVIGTLPIHFAIFYGCFEATLAEMSHCNRDHMTLQKPQYLLSAPLHEKFATPDSEYKKQKEMTELKDRTGVKSIKPSNCLGSGR